MSADLLLFRCSSLGKLMTDPRSKADGPLSQTAKTHIRELAAQILFGVDFEFYSKETEKGIECEPDSIALLNRVRGLSLVKNTERRNNGLITGECDLHDAPRRRGHDIKTPWSIKSFPIVPKACEDKDYEWQAQGYMILWDADEWEVNYCLVSTPERLIGYEPQALHFVEHIPEHQRVTTWLLKRDPAKADAIAERVKLGREYLAEVLAEFDRCHPQTFAEVAALVDSERTPARTQIKPAELPESIF